MPSPSESTPGHPSRSARTGAAAHGARRTFTDRRGTPWHVHEERIPVEEWTTADLESSASGYGVGWLVFERSGEPDGAPDGAPGDDPKAVRKRLRLYPADWHLLPDAELRRLCSRARRFRQSPGVAD